jgi:sugar lactone lactonase YvrE
MYALETTASGVAPPLSDPSAGRLVRVEPDGSITPLVTGLAFPTALMAGRDGAFYISNCGYHCDDPATGASLEAGQVLRVSIRGVEAVAAAGERE